MERDGGVDRSAMQQVELGEVECRLVLAGAGEANQVVDDLGDAERRQRCITVEDQLSHHTGGGFAPEQRLDHMAFAVPDRAALAGFEERLDELGATYTTTAETPFGAVVVFRDPDGIQLEFFVTDNGS